MSIIESLESRCLFSANVHAMAPHHHHHKPQAPTPTIDAKGIVHVQGTNKSDTIVLGVSDDHSKMTVTLDGTVTEFTLSDVKGIVANGGNGNDSIKVLSGGILAGPVTLIGGNGNDTLQGSKGDDLLLGGNGKDSINGGDGNDQINGGNGNDQIDGGNGNDSIRGGNGNDNILGSAGDDSIVGGPGNDKIDGGSGNNTILDKPAHKHHKH